MAFLSEDLRQKIAAYLPRYPSKQAVTLPALHLVHDEMRCVPREAIKEIADMLDLSPAEVHDAMTFYEFFHEENGRIAVESEDYREGVRAWGERRSPRFGGR